MSLNHFLWHSRTYSGRERKGEGREGKREGKEGEREGGREKGGREGKREGEGREREREGGGREGEGEGGREGGREGEREGKAVLTSKVIVHGLAILGEKGNPDKQDIHVHITHTRGTRNIAQVPYIQAGCPALRGPYCMCLYIQVSEKVCWPSQPPPYVPQ